MSLVNDMLRDLDQRRKGSDAASNSVSLVPAPELARVRNINARKIIISALVLFLAVVGLGYFWWQSNSEQNFQQLNIEPQVVNTVAEPIETSTVSDATEIPVAQTAERIQAGNSEVSDAQQPANQDTQAQEVNTVATETTTIDNLVLADETNIDNAPDLPVAAVASSGIANLDNRDEIPLTPDPVSSREQPARESRPDGIVDLRNQEPIDSVKDSSVLTAEEKDTIAVQEALRLIAESQTIEAYAHLESHIMDNRYAHQSRETYAKLLISQGDLQSAYDLAEEGLALAPNHSGFKKIKARLLIQDGQLELAAEILMSRAPQVAENLEYHDLLATALFASRDYEGALISYTGLVQQDQSQGKWWYGFAASHDLLGNANAAYQGYNQALKHPNLSASLRRRSQERLFALSQ